MRSGRMALASPRIWTSPPYRRSAGGSKDPPLRRTHARDVEAGLQTRLEPNDTVCARICAMRTITSIVCAVALAAASLGAQYSLTVNKDRLINAQNEPQNWLLMNG